MRKLQENFACFQNTLVDAEVFSSFTSIVNKAKKFAKPEVKVRVQLVVVVVVVVVVCACVCVRVSACVSYPHTKVVLYRVGVYIVCKPCSCSQ